MRFLDAFIHIASAEILLLMTANTTGTILNRPG